MRRFVFLNATLTVDKLQTRTPFYRVIDDLEHVVLYYWNTSCQDLMHMYVDVNTQAAKSLLAILVVKYTRTHRLYRFRVTEFKTERKKRV